VSTTEAYETVKRIRKEVYELTDGHWTRGQESILAYLEDELKRMTRKQRIKR
jgi:hypothetical protein